MCVLWCVSRIVSLLCNPSSSDAVNKPQAKPLEITCMSQHRWMIDGRDTLLDNIHWNISPNVSGL